MNEARRKAISALVAEFDQIKEQLEGRVSGLKEALETLKDEEQDYYDNMHENLRGGDKGQRAEQAISEMDDVLSNLDNLLEAINEIDLNTIDLS